MSKKWLNFKNMLKSRYQMGSQNLVTTCSFLSLSFIQELLFFCIVKISIYTQVSRFDSVIFRQSLFKKLFGSQVLDSHRRWTAHFLVSSIPFGGDIFIFFIAAIILLQMQVVRVCKFLSDGGVKWIAVVVVFIIVNVRMRLTQIIVVEHYPVRAFVSLLTALSYRALRGSIW